MGDAVTSKPVGPMTVFLKTETTLGTYAAPSATDALLLLGEPKLGGQTSEWEFSEETHITGGRYSVDEGGLNDGAGELTIPLKGSGTAGTSVTAREAALEDGAGLSKTVVGGTSVTYASNQAPGETGFSLSAIDRRDLSVTQLWGCMVNVIRIEAEVDGTKPRMTVGFSYQRKIQFEKTTINDAGGISDADLSVVFGDAECIRFGLSDTSISSTAILAKIEDEVVTITAWNATTSTATITRASEGTAAAAHADTTAVYPYLPAPTFGEAGSSVGKTNWTATVGGSAFRMRSFEYEFQTGRVFDPRSSGLAYSDSVDWEGHKGSGKITYIRELSREHERRNVDTGANREIVVTFGSTAGSIFTLTIPYARMKGIPDGQLEKSKATEQTIEFEAYDQATTFGPQFQLAMT